MLTRKCFLILIFALSSDLTTFADVVIYTNEGDFQNTIPGFEFESFESLADTPASSNPVSTDFFEFTPLLGQLQLSSTPTGGSFPTDGNRYLGIGLVDSFIVRIDLAKPSTAFGFSVTDFGDQSSGELLVSTNVGEASTGLTIAAAPLPNGNELFFGFTQDTPFDSLLFFQTTVEDGVGIDGIYALSIPEPSGVVALALVTFCFCNRRFRSRGN